MTPAETTFAAYARQFEAFSPETAGDIGDPVRDDVRFRDPFHDVTGREAMIAVLRSMFRVFEVPRFTVTDRALGERHGFLLWQFDGITRRGDRLAFDGTTTLLWDADGRVAEHLDHWDAAGAIHVRLPLIGCGVRYANRRIAALAKG